MARGGHPTHFYRSFEGGRTVYYHDWNIGRRLVKWPTADAELLIATGEATVSQKPKSPWKKNNPLPSVWTDAHVWMNRKGQLQVAVNPAKLGTGARFAACVHSVASRGDAYDPRAVCASQGRKKYGKKRFQKMAAAGRRRKR